MPERIGLEAVLDMAGFNRGIAQYVRGVGKIERFSGLATKQFGALGLAVVGVTAAIGAAVVAYKALAAVTRLTIDLAVSSTKAAISVESAFAGVVKTTDGLVDEFGRLNAIGRELRQEFRDLALEVPLAVEELMAIGEVGGQLGVAREDMIEFTKVVSALGVATRLSTEAAATGLSQLAAIMGTKGKDFERLGSVIVGLGNKLGVAEGKTLSFGLRIASAAKLAGISEAALLGIGAAFARVGIEAEAGGTAVMTAILNFEKFVNEAGAELRLLAKVAGVTAGEFKRLWVEDAEEAFTRFVEGLGRAGKDAQAVLEALELGSTRSVRAFLSVASAGDLVRESIAMSFQDWQENLALQREADLRYATTAAQLQILNNTIRDMKSAFGDELLPVLNEFLFQALPMLQQSLIPMLETLMEVLGAVAKESLIPLIMNFGVEFPDAIENSFLPAVITVLKALQAIGKGIDTTVGVFWKFMGVMDAVMLGVSWIWQLISDIIRVAVHNAGVRFTQLVDVTRAMWKAIEMVAQGEGQRAMDHILWIVNQPLNILEEDVPGRAAGIAHSFTFNFQQALARDAPALFQDMYQTGIDALAAFQAGLAGARMPTAKLPGWKAWYETGRPAGVAPPIVPGLPGAAGIPGLGDLLAAMESSTRTRGAKIRAGIDRDIVVPLESALEAAVQLGQTFAQIGSAFSRVIEERYVGPLAEFLEKTEDAVAALSLPKGALLPFLHIPGMAELLSARAEATERIAEAEAKILALQEQQAQLDFLGQQVKLLELIQEHGLDAAEVLGEMTLGLEADPLMMIEAMTRAVNRIVTQTQAELVALGGVTPAGAAGGQVFQSSTEANFGPINIYDMMDLEAFRSLVMQWVTEG